jgi:hypothetical protein
MGWALLVGVNHNPIGVEESFRASKPRVALRLATLGFEAESLWDSQRRAEQREDVCLAEASDEEIGWRLLQPLTNGTDFQTTGWLSNNGSASIIKRKSTVI